MARDVVKRAPDRKIAVGGQPSVVRGSDLGFCPKVYKKAISSRDRKRKDSLNAKARLAFKVGSRLYILIHSFSFIYILFFIQIVQTESA